MNDVFKKMFLTSIGMAALTKSKMEEFAKEYASLYQKSESEGEKIYNDLMNEAQKTTHEWEEKIKHYTNEALKNLNIATADRIAALEKRVTELEAKLASKSN